MQNVVFCEGKNDVYLLCEIHKRCSDVDEFDTYLSEDASLKQTKWLRQHTADSRFRFLYKSEEGDGNLIKKFKSHSLTFTTFSIHILVDLDSEPFDDFLIELNGKLSEDYGNKVSVDVLERKFNDDMVICETKLRIDGVADRDLPIMAFSTSLENVAGISDGDDRSTKRHKIREYLDGNPRVQDDIASIIH